MPSHVDTAPATREELVLHLQDRAGQAYELWRPRNEQMVEDRAMYTMSYKTARRGQELYLSNEARAFLDKATEILSAKWPIVRMPVVKQREEQRRVMSDAERMLDGILREVALRYRRRGRNSWLYDLCWYTDMGTVCGYYNIRETPNGDVEFRCDLWDPIQVYPVFGENGIEELYRQYRLTPLEALSMARANGYETEHLGDTLDKESVVIINAFWVEGEEAYNAILIDGKLVKPRTEHSEWGGRIPVLIYPAAGLPYRGFDFDGMGGSSFSVPDWPRSWGQPIFAANRDVYKTLDKTLTWDLRIMRKFSLPMGVSNTASGDPVIEARDIETDRVSLIPLKMGEKFEWLKPPTSPQERLTMLSYLSGAAQRGGISNIAFGELGLDLPGVAIERLMAATKSTLLPYVETAEFFISELCMGFMEMYRRGEYSKVQLNVKQNFGGESIQVYQEDFSPETIPETTLVLVKLPMGLPDRKLQNMTIARTAIPGNEPLLDDVTVAEDILETPDYELVKDRIAEMRAERDPAFQLLAIIQGLRRRQADFRELEPPDEEGAAMIDRIIAIRLQQFAAATGGAGAPPGPVEPRNRELSPEIAPPEETGVSPDELVAQPPQGGGGGAAPTVEQRLAGIGLTLGRK